MHADLSSAWGAFASRFATDLSDLHPKSALLVFGPKQSSRRLGFNPIMQEARAIDALAAAADLLVPLLDPSEDSTAKHFHSRMPSLHFDVCSRMSPFSPLCQLKK